MNPSIHFEQFTPANPVDSCIYSIPNGKRKNVLNDLKLKIKTLLKIPKVFTSIGNGSLKCDTGFLFFFYIHLFHSSGKRCG